MTKVARPQALDSLEVRCINEKIAILGSTGSIGTQTLDVVDMHPEHFQVEALAAGAIQIC